MINGQKVLGLITARGGSKGVPGKNIQLAGGKPLIAWTIEAAQDSVYLDRLIISSDDDAIIEVAENYGCEVPFKREAYLAADDTPSIDVVLDALGRCPGYDWVVLLQPTSPLRTSDDIDGALNKCIELDAPACVSVCEAEQSPFWMYFQKNARLHPVIEMSPVFRRQDLPKVYALNGAIYVSQTSWLIKHHSLITTNTVAYEMPSNRSLDIDTQSDLKLFEMLLTQ